MWKAYKLERNFSEGVFLALFYNYVLLNYEENKCTTCWANRVLDQFEIIPKRENFKEFSENRELQAVCTTIEAIEAGKAKEIEVASLLTHEYKKLRDFCGEILKVSPIE